MLKGTPPHTSERRKTRFRADGNSVCRASFCPLSITRMRSNCLINWSEIDCERCLSRFSLRFLASRMASGVAGRLAAPHAAALSTRQFPGFGFFRRKSLNITCARGERKRLAVQTKSSAGIKVLSGGLVIPIGSFSWNENPFTWFQNLIWAQIIIL